jgi:hypothetical protein
LTLKILLGELDELLLGIQEEVSRDSIGTLMAEEISSQWLLPAASVALEEGRSVP